MIKQTLGTPVENCVEKWQNRYICHFDLLSSESLPNFVINALSLSIRIRIRKKQKNKSARGNHIRTLKMFIFG